MADFPNSRNHVYRDLRPYVCTFTDCISGEKQYHARHAWIHHETQVHRRQWVCPGPCNKVFGHRGHMAQHLCIDHQEQFTDEQIPLVLTLSESSLNDDVIESCPLCPVRLSLVRLHAHIAEHLEQISLFVLPCKVVDTMDSSKGSNHALGDGGDLSGFDSIGTREQDDPDLSPLEFVDIAQGAKSDSGDPPLGNALDDKDIMPLTEVADWSLVFARKFEKEEVTEEMSYESKFVSEEEAERKRQHYRGSARRLSMRSRAEA